MTISSPSLLVATLLLAVAAHASAVLAENLVPDPSFEAPTPAWFSEEGNLSYFAAKAKVAGADTGTNVLTVAGWNEGGSLIPSGPIVLRGSEFSGTMAVRSFGPSTDGTVELALYDVGKTNKLASFGEVSINGRGKWATVRASRVKLRGPATEGVLAITVSGVARGVRIEIDSVGLFPGPRVAKALDTAELMSFEAESMTTTGKAWKPRTHFPSWYQEFPSGMTMLSGSERVSNVDDAAATYTLNVKTPGPFTLWTRFLRTNSKNHGAFTVALKQGGKVVASATIEDDSDARFGGNPLSWVFTPLTANLRPGPVEIALTRPRGEVAWMARKVDMFVLTNLAYYQPKIQDFRAQGYMRFTNRSQASFCLFEGVRRHQGPVYDVPRMWTAAGLWFGYRCTEDKRLRPGEPSPWVRITDDLSPAHDHNNLSLLATTQSHTAGFVQGELKGTLEFGLGPEHRVVKTIEIDQTSPRVLLTLGTAFTPDTLLTAADYILKEQAAVARIPSISRPRARYLDLAVILGGISADVDPPEIVDKEIGIIGALGFNATYTPLIEPRKLKTFYRAHGLEHFGIAGVRPVFKAGYLNEVDLGNLARQWESIAKDFASVLDQIERAKVFDEPRGIAYEALAASPYSKEAFSNWLKGRGISVSDLGLSRWDEVVLTSPDQSAVRPKLFYWTGIYRLNLLANAAKAVVAARKAAGLPDNIKSYANYGPTWGSDTFTEAGADPFLMQRDGGFELGWTEDWLGYGASVEQVSDQVAVIRAAGAPNHQELGMYVVGGDGPPALQRLRLYEALAAGVRHICSYNYGPYYSSIDSWGARYEVYQHISDALHDFGAIDTALRGTTRRKSDVAILYNRSAAIWAGGNTAMEQDGRFMFWALSHAGYQPDFIPEEDVERGGLGKYKVLYALGTQMRKQTARAIADWVSNGGAVFATAGAGSHDEYDRPLDTLEKPFGARSTELSLFADPGRPKYELRKLKPWGILETVRGSGVPDVKFNRLCARETLLPASDARVVMRDPSGAPAAVLHSYGKGVALRLAALPGLAYVNDAVKEATFDIESYHPTKYRPELRDFIGFLPKLAKAERLATNAPIAEVARYDAEDRVVLIVVNHGAPVSNFQLMVPDAVVASGYSATGAPVVVNVRGDKVAEVTFDLKDADALVLTRRPGIVHAVLGASRAPSARYGCVAGAKSEGTEGWLGMVAWSALALARRRSGASRRSGSRRPVSKPLRWVGCAAPR